MIEKVEVTEQNNEETKQIVARRAAERARVARWDLDIAVFLFVVLILVLILLFQNVSIEVVASVAVFGLAVVWLTGWRRGKKLYRSFYEEELFRMEREFKKREETAKEIEEVIEETIEEKVLRVLRQRWQ